MGNDLSKSAPQAKIFDNFGIPVKEVGSFFGNAQCTKTARCNIGLSVYAPNNARDSKRHSAQSPPKCNQLFVCHDSRKKDDRRTAQYAQRRWHDTVKAEIRSGQCPVLE